MEFGEKIQKLRNQNKWTQEQLAEKLYVSRTAVSKWESGKGYPNIASLKDIAKLFGKTIDELLSNEEIIDIAKNENTTNMKRTNNLIYGLLDIISVLFIFLPLYAKKTEDFIYSVSLIGTNDISNIIKISYIIILSFLSLIGIAELIIQFVDNKKIQRILNVISLITETFAILFFAISRQTYLTAIIFIILIIKIIIVVKNISNKNDII
ncbi:MAG: helix-turn-helix transcriptional regulator [Clostridia bacterium]|nr:helix-turn-helix transcriptional regulator [Clostridia bacterium]